MLDNIDALRQRNADLEAQLHDVTSQLQGLHRNDKSGGYVLHDQHAADNADNGAQSLSAAWGCAGLMPSTSHATAAIAAGERKLNEVRQFTFISLLVILFYSGLSLFICWQMCQQQRDAMCAAWSELRKRKAQLDTIVLQRSFNEPSIVQNPS